MNRHQLSKLELGDLVIVTRGADAGVIAKVVGWDDDSKEYRYKGRVDAVNPKTGYYAPHCDAYLYGRMTIQEQEQLWIQDGYKRLHYGLIIESIEPNVVFHGDLQNKKRLNKDKKQKHCGYEVVKPLWKEEG